MPQKTPVDGPAIQAEGGDIYTARYAHDARVGHEPDETPQTPWVVLFDVHNRQGADAFGRRSTTSSLPATPPRLRPSSDANASASGSPTARPPSPPTPPPNRQRTPPAPGQSSTPTSKPTTAKSSPT